MMYYFNKTSIGYNHIKKHKKCQDHSSCYHDEERTIITCCDGHGGNIYIRSDLGAKFASEAMMHVFKKISSYDTRKYSNSEYLDSLKLGILCEWNRLVETHLSLNHILKSDVESLTDNERYKLLNNKVKAYGTTMIGAMLLNNKLLIVHLGDGEAVLLKNGNILQPFPEDEDEPVGNMTYSMCEEDAYNHIQIGYVEYSDYDGILLCTDGMVNPYQNYDNFNQSMVQPLINELKSNGDYSQISLFVENVGRNIGIGDDISLSFIIKSKQYEMVKKSITKNSEFKSYSDYYEYMYGYKRRNSILK